ncbi:MAG TPA: exo-alpha-sialidase [Candidatus Paceibacterota bacterium]|nr:exo-alpha-sialidase [Candidatus Paceibacterota bacterium]
MARLGPKADLPYFNVRFALPVPPDNDTNLTGAILGIDPYVWSHNHSPGLEVLPNGDVLAVYFSARNSGGTNESAPETRFIQARLRFGAEEWDMPELFFDSRDFNDQSALLWQDGNTLRFFGGGRDNPAPFKLATSTDNGASWTFSLPLLYEPANDFTPQPIANAFRDPHGGIYFAMDAKEDQSFLWRSADGVHWHDMGGRTDGRHSTIVPLDGKTLLSIGGKNAGTNGHSFRNISTNWGESWSEPVQSPFPALGGNQRPCLIRLANGHLCFVSDSYHRKKEKAPEGWKLGEGCFVAISKDDGATWHFKMLPVTLPHEADRRNGTLGYATVRQGPNGVIHLLATMTGPCLHYEFNEAWVFSEAGDIAPDIHGGKAGTFTEKYPDGKVRAVWSARIAVNGRYLLDGAETTFYPNGRKEHEAIYAGGRKTGTETFWTEDGTKLWNWFHDLKNNHSVWTHYWPNGARRIESNWNTRPEARDLKRSFVGHVANGPAYEYARDGSLTRKCLFTNGAFAGEVRLNRSDAR